MNPGNNRGDSNFRTAAYIISLIKLIESIRSKAGCIGILSGISKMCAAHFLSLPSYTVVTGKAV